MKLDELLSVAPHSKLLIMVGLDAGTKETFDVTIVRGDRNGGWRPEFREWLSALNLEVDRVGACSEDADGNKDLLCVFCKPIKIEIGGK